MIISHQHKYLFIEVPHTASTAIASELVEHYSGRKILGKHANYTEFRQQASRQERKYFVFAAVRNPLDVVITEYFKYKTNHRNAFTSLDKNGRWVSKEHQKRFESVQQGLEPSEFVRKFYSTVYNNWFLIGHQHFGNVMRFENIADDFAKVLAHIGISPVRALPVVNKTKRPATFVDFYPLEVVPHVVRIFGPFMRYWGYEFPESWGAQPIPLRSFAGYRVKEYAANAAARAVTLNPNNRTLQFAKRCLNRVT